jgi:hypothetical protein
MRILVIFDLVTLHGRPVCGSLLAHFRFCLMSCRNQACVRTRGTHGEARFYPRRGMSASTHSISPTTRQTEHCVIFGGFREDWRPIPENLVATANCFAFSY